MCRGKRKDQIKWEGKVCECENVLRIEEKKEIKRSDEANRGER